MVNIDKWTLYDLIDACLGEPNNTKKIRLLIPKFQRRRAWSKQQEDELIDTLKLNSISIGTLQLFHKVDDSKKAQDYILVDGLHRVTTLLNYYKNPFSFQRTEKLIKQICDDLSEKFSARNKKQDCQRLCLNWFSFTILGNYDDFVGEKKYVDKFDTLKKDVKKYINEKDIDECVKYMTEKTRELAKNCDISKSVIPVIFNSGNLDMLPLLFRRINKNGTPLTSCDILACSWHGSDKIKIKNKRIVEQVNEYYDEMKKENNGIEICPDEEKQNNKFTIFEYILGLQRDIFKSHSDTFIKYISDKEFLFRVISACLFEDMTKNSINKIKNKLLDQDLEHFEERLIWAVKYVIKILDPFSVLSGETKYVIMKDIPLIATFIAIAFNNKNAISKKESYYKKIFIGHMLNHKLSEKSLNSKTMKHIISTKLFMKEIDKKEFADNIERFFNSQNNLKNTNLVSKSLKMLVNQALFVITHKNYSQIPVDIDYIIPKKIITKYINSNLKYVPVNITSNMVIRPIFEKKRKPNQSLLTYLVDEDIDIKTIYDKYLFVTESELDDFEGLVEDLEFEPIDYIKFIKIRSDNIKKQFLNYFKDVIINDTEFDVINIKKSKSDDVFTDTDISDNSESSSESSSESDKEDHKINIVNKKKNNSVKILHK